MTRYVAAAAATPVKTTLAPPDRAGHPRSALSPCLGAARCAHLKGVRERMMPNTSVLWMACTLPASSGRSSSSTLPRATTISCTLGAEKLP